MKKGKQNFKKILFLVSSLFILLCTVLSCNSWMEDDGFYEDIENEVKYANAPELQVFVRYAATKMGKTVPEGNTIFKKEIESTISATTETEYGFYRWAAFSTSFLEAGDKQHSDFVFDNAESYAEKYGVNELPDSVVHFEDRTNPTTKVTILEERNDVFIVPVVAKRPTVALTIPGNGSNGVVRNMTVRINFTKAMDVTSFKNAEDVFDKITVNQGSQSITADGDIDVSSIDITDHFDTPTISTNGKMLTLKFTEDAIKEGFSAQSYVNVQISREVKDIYGYSMADDYTLSFQVGTGFDTLAPRISELSAGIKSDFTTFKALYKDAGTKDNLGSFTTFTSNQGAPATLNSDISADYYSAELMAQRVTDKVNIRVLAEDISGSGTEQSQMGVESDVSQIMIRAIRVFNMDGNYVAQQDGNTKPFKSIPYVAQSNTSELEGGYADLITAANANLPESARLNKSKGFLFTYEDFNDFEDGLIRIDIGAVDAVGNTGFGDGGAYSSEYGNGYVTLFVVKDTTPPVLDTNRITSTSTSSPYGYYNAQTFNTINVRDNGIYDAGTEKLRSPHDDIKWIIKAGADTSWVSTYLPEDDSWKPITDDYPLGSVAQPSSDGPMAITYALMDDLGNISEGGQISSITYDNTAPVIGTLDWVNNSGIPCLNTTTDNTTGDTLLQIPFTEVTSGVRRLIVSVNGVSNAFASSSYYATLTDSPITVNTSDSAYSDTVKPFATMYISDSGNFYIKNINLPNTDGSYNINVAMVDSALNTSSTVSTTFSVDKTLPVVSELKLLNTELSGSTNWINGKSGHTLSFKVKEEGSGINIIELSGVTLSSPVLKCNNTVISSSEYSVSGTTLTLNNYKNPKIQGADCSVEISGIELNANENVTNRVTVKTKDFANTGTYSNDDNYDVKWDSTPTKFADNTITIKNISSNSTEYTNTAHVKLTVDVPVESSGSGITTLVITDGATYNGTNTIPVSSTGSQSYEVDLTATDGTATLKIKTVDLVGNESEESSASITLDTVVPAIGTMSWDVGSTDMQPGIFNGTKMDQALVIPFTEATAGVNKITIEVIMPNGTSYSHPLVNTNLTITDGTNTLTNITDYTISGKIITLTEPRTSGTLKISGIHVAVSAVEGTYTFEAKLTDAAGNEMSTPATLTANNDSTAPEITQLYVPGIVRVRNDYWISKEYAYYDDKANPVEIELTVKENNSGISKIEFDTTNIDFNNVKVKLNNDLVDCTPDLTAKTITITPEYAINKNGTNESVTIKIEGVCVFTGNLSNMSNNRTIKLKVYDVAGNVNTTSYGTIASDGDGIPVSNAETIRYANSSPNIHSVTLTDRSDTGHKAQEGFTNEQYVNLKIELTSISINSCPVYKITLDGATFDNTGENLIRVKNGSSDINVTSDQLIISNDKKSLAIKPGSGYAEMANGSGLDKNTITINNVKLDSATEGAHTVNVTVTNACQFTASTEYTITLDTKKPEWNTTNPLYSYYDNSYASKIYPTPQASSKAYGTVISSAQYFYTAFKDGSDTTESCYVAGDCTESNLLGFTTSGTTLSAENTAAKLTAGNTEYSIVAVDKAGNVSDVKKCYVKAENSKESINVSELYNRITLVKPDASADIYRMDRFEDSSFNSSEAKIKYHETTDWNIYAYKTVIKSTTENYVIKVKMGSGLTASDKKIFGGSVTPTSSSFTNYNPTTTHSPVTAYTITHYYRHWAGTYEGRKPFEPRFPEGTEPSTLTSYFNSEPSYNWTNSSVESTTSNCTWHEMSKRNFTNIDDQISSYVDENGDINIKIPTTGKIPPLTLLLKNGTGQLNYVYLTELSNGTTIPNAWNYVTTWEVDDKLGSILLSGGKTTSRAILMNPGVEYDTSESSDTLTFGGVKFKWYSQSSSTSNKNPQGNGESRTGTLVKNLVKKTTYYNDNAWFGCQLIGTETIYGASEGKVTPPNSNSKPDSYSVRLKLCCVPITETASINPNYFADHSSNGQATEWVYSNGSSSGKPNVFIQYPHPNYSALGWNKNTEYKIYYLIEDYVGNYDINTVVNSTDDNDMVYWLYDAEAPKVTVGDTGLPPDDSSISINQLIPNTNGYQAYQYQEVGQTKYVAIPWNYEKRDGATINETQREGTTRKVLGDPDNDYRYNCPFFDIKVTDDSGIRAFAYSKTSDVPELNNFENAQQGEGKWFAGSSGSTSGFGKDEVIGNSATYTGYTNYNKYDAGSDYNGKYSGTPVCSVFPNDYDNTPIYLHVMDWVGNVSTYRMGNNVTWNKDITPPSANSAKESYSEEYYLNNNSSAGTLEFAGKKVVGLTSTKVYLPSDFYTDSGSSVLGWSLTQNKVDTIQKDSTGSYIELTLSDYNETATPKTVYVYDGVGNCKEYSYNISKDSTPPSYNLYVRSNGSGTTGSLYVKDVGYNQHGHTSHPKNYLLPDNLNPTTRLTESLYTDEASIKANSYYVYTDENGITFLPNSSEVTVNSKIDIFKWSGTQWNKVSSYTSTSSTGGTFQIETNWCTCPTIQVDGTNAGYFCFALSDRAGNTNYAYVYAKKDVTPPAVETICTNVNTVGSTNYYGPYGSVKYKVTQYDSGIYQINTEDPLSTYTTEVGPRNYLGTSNPYSVVVYNNNRKGATVNLEWNGVSNWSYDNSTPSCGSISSAKQYIANNYYSQANTNISGVDVTRKQGEGYSSITISPTNTSHVSTISATGVSSFKINNVSNFVGSTTAKGWKVIESSSGVPTKPDFVSWDGIDVGKTDNSYTFNSSNWTDKSYYFYPVNYAGTVGNPIVFTFETPIKPTVTKESVTGDYNNTSQIYFKDSCNASLIIKNPSTSKAISVTGYFLYAKDSGDYSYITEETFAEPISINPNNSSNYNLIISNIGDNNGKKIYVQIKTNYTVSDYVSIGDLVKDTTAPTNIKIDSVKSNNLSSGFGYKVSDTKVMYGNNTTKVELILTATENVSGIAGYSLDQVTWSNTITINKATSFNSSYTVYAKDNVGNIASQDFTFASDSIAPSITNFSCTAANTYIDSTNKKIYFNSASLPVTVTSTDTDVGYYKYNSNTSETGEFSLSDAGDYVFYAVDKVGNESSPYTIKLIKDSVPPATPSGTLTFYNGETQVTTGYIFDNVNNTVRFNPNKVTKVVFTPSAQTDDATTAGDGLGSGIKGYSGSRTATEWTATVTSALSSTDSGKEYKFYSCDNVGNVCTSSLKYTFTADATGPQPSGSIKTEPPYGSFKSGDTPEIKGIYVSTSEVPTTFVYDDIVGNNYVSLIYTPGDDFTVSLTDSDCVGYAFTCGCDSSATTQPTSFTSITPVGTTITVPMPECELPHYYIFLWLQDSIGNVSVYNLIQDNSGEKNWWLAKDSSPEVKYSYEQSTGKLTISGLTCIPLKSISIAGENIYNISTNSITFDFDMPTNYMSNKSYNKNISWNNNGSGSFTGTFGNPQLTGTGTIVINIGNAATNINVSINSENGSGGIVATPNKSSPIQKLTKVVSSKVRTILTPKTKKIYLSSEVETKTIEKDTGVISQNNQPSLTKTASPKKNNKAKVRKANNSNKVLDSSVVKNTVIQKKNNVIPEDAKVLEVSSIEPSVNASVITSEVINNSGVETTVEKTDVSVSKHKQNSILVYSLIALVMCAVIAMVVIVNKIIIDKTK